MASVKGLATEWIESNCVAGQACSGYHIITPMPLNINPAGSEPLIIAQVHGLAGRSSMGEGTAAECKQA
jgi:hypothetical protein